MAALARARTAVGAAITVIDVGHHVAAISVAAASLLSRSLDHRDMIHFVSLQKCTFSPQSIFYPLFLNEDGRIRGKRLSMLHNRFLRYSTLPKTLLLESQYLQSYDDFLQILA